MKTKRAPELSRYVVVVTCVVLQKSKKGAWRLLILKRPANESEGPGLWTIPGGRVDPRDWGRAQKTDDGRRVWMNILKRACKREILEETGLTVREVIVMPGREKIFIRRDGTPTLVIVFRCFVAPSSEAKRTKTACRWVAPSELGGYKFIGNVPDDIRFALRTVPARPRR